MKWLGVVWRRTCAYIVHTRHVMHIDACAYGHVTVYFLHLFIWPYYKNPLHHSHKIKNSSEFSKLCFLCPHSMCQSAFNVPSRCQRWESISLKKTAIHSISLIHAKSSKHIFQSKWFKDTAFLKDGRFQPLVVAPWLPRGSSPNGVLSTPWHPRHGCRGAKVFRASSRSSPRAKRWPNCESANSWMAAWVQTLVEVMNSWLVDGYI